MDNPDTKMRNLDDVYSRWYRRLRESQFGHHEAYLQYTSLHYKFAIPAVLFSTFIGSSLFLTLNLNKSIETQIIVGLISLASSVIASFQVFFNFSEKAEEHKRAAARYGSLRREMERIATLDKDDRIILSALIANLINHVSEDSPTIPKKAWDKVTTKLEADPSWFEQGGKNE